MDRSAVAVLIRQLSFHRLIFGLNRKCVSGSDFRFRVESDSDDFGLRCFGQSIRSESMQSRMARSKLSNLILGDNMSGVMRKQTMLFMNRFLHKPSCTKV